MLPHCNMINCVEGAAGNPNPPPLPLPICMEPFDIVHPKIAVVVPVLPAVPERYVVNVLVLTTGVAKL